MGDDHPAAGKVLTSWRHPECFSLPENECKSIEDLRGALLRRRGQRVSARTRRVPAPALLLPRKLTKHDACACAGFAELSAAEQKAVRAAIEGGMMERGELEYPEEEEEEPAPPPKKRKKSGGSEKKKKAKSAEKKPERAKEKPKSAEKKKAAKPKEAAKSKMKKRVAR